MRALIYFFFVVAAAGFAFERKCSYPLIRQKECRIHRRSNTRLLSTHSEDEETPIQVRCTSFRLPLDKELNTMYRRRKFLPGRTKVSLEDDSELLFEYEYNQLNIEAKDKAEDTTIKAIILIQPIGVGIGRWYYDRLLHEFQVSQKDYKSEVILVAPDLLGCGTACSPMMVSSKNDAPRLLEQLPLLQVKDWSSQILDLMHKIESENANDVEFCIISNGGCVPIALDVVDRLRHERKQLKGKLKHLIFSATPSISSLLKPKDNEKIAKSYRTLSGTVGNLFWWYALRKEGKFLQSFSEKNLASKPENLGENWRPQCFQTARANKGKSRYSTFAFLAGALNGGCTDILEELKSQNEIKVDIITGGAKRENKARTWFWQRAPKEKKVQDEDIVDEEKEETTLVTYFNDNDSSFVQEILTGGRRCPAHEDSKGFITAIESLFMQ